MRDKRSKRRFAMSERMQRRIASRPLQSSPLGFALERLMIRFCQLGPAHPSVKRLAFACLAELPIRPASKGGSPSDA